MEGQNCSKPKGTVILLVFPGVTLQFIFQEIPYDIKPISLIKSGGEQHCNEYREVNPMEQVPALQIDGHTFIESLSIMYYLEETRPQRPLLPQDVIKRAKVREICEVIASGIQPLQNLIVLIHVGEEKKKEWAQHWITRGFRAVEKLLSTSAGKFCVGDEVSLADCCLVPQVFNARRFHVDLRPFPTILRVDRELEGHPAFRAAHPSNQPGMIQSLLATLDSSVKILLLFFRLSSRGS